MITTEANMEDITPLEEAILNAHEFAAGLASMAIVHDMVQRSEESSKAVRDRELPREIRAQALKDGRECNQALNLVASARALVGISA